MKNHQFLLVQEVSLLKKVPDITKTLI